MAGGSIAAPLPGAAERRWDIALRNQLTVLWALFLRDANMRRGRRFLLGFIASGFEPLAVVLTLGMLFSILVRETPYGRSPLLFLGTGVFPIYMFIYTTTHMRQPLGLGKHRQRYPIERVLDHVLVNGVQHFLISLVVSALFFFTLYSIGVPDALPYDPAMAIEALSAVFFFALAMGIFNMVFERIVPLWGLLWPALGRTALHFSGMYYVAAHLPARIRWVFDFNPVMHGTNWFRHAFYPFYPNYASSGSFLLFAGLALMTFSLLLEAATRQFLESKE